MKIKIVSEFSLERGAKKRLINCVNYTLSVKRNYTIYYTTLNLYHLKRVTAKKFHNISKFFNNFFSFSFQF